MRRLLGLALVISACATVAAFGQGIPGRTDVVFSPADSVLQLPHEFISLGSFTLVTAEGDTLRSPDDFTIDLRFGRVLFSSARRALFSGDPTASDSIRLAASYRYLPLDVPREVRLRELVTLTDSTGARTVVAQPSGGGLTATDVFGKDFRRSGSLTRGVTVGSNRDLSVQSGLRLEFSGKITDDVEVLGALTDEQTPIQPEGNTQTLREIDNVFIEIRSPVADGTLGKFVASGGAGEFTSFTRKLQGVKGTGRFGDVGTTSIVAAVSPGKFRTQEFGGREGDQGPYRLTGPSGERDIIVVAGTERVFVDGIEMIRGTENDYVIDYGTGEITFQPRRPITSTNEIVVDFEYSDRRYARSFLAGSHSVLLFDSTTRFTASFVREADDPNAPIDLTFSDADRALLEAAGADPSAAVRSGVIFVGRSDTASGSYMSIDTVIDGRSDTIYRYAPQSPDALYDVIFSRPPDGRGDYRSVAFGQYEFVGAGLGEFLPVIFLPLPGLQQVGALTLSIAPTDDTYLTGDIAFSGVSLNRASSDPAAERSDVAFNGTGVLREDEIRLGGLNLGRFILSANTRYVGAEFQGVERLGEVEFDRKWNTAARPGESGFDDFLVEANGDWYPTRRLNIILSGGFLDRGDYLSSLRQRYAARFGEAGYPLAADYAIEHITTDDSLGGGLESGWLKQWGGVSYRLGRVIPGIRFEQQKRDDLRAGRDTLLGSSFSYLEVGPDLTVELPSIRTIASARYRVDDSARYDPAFEGTRFLDDSRSQTYRLRGEYTGGRALRSTIDFTYRLHRFDSIPTGASFNRLDNATILARSETRWNGLNKGIEVEAVYEVQTERAARLQRLFVRVPIGQGEYVWVDIDSNGVQTENEFRETIGEQGEYVRVTLPTEQLFPVVDLDAALQLRLKPETFVSDSSFLGRVLRPVTSETFLRLSEKSETENESDVYLLQLGTFQNDSTTLLGSGLIQQDFHLFERDPDFNLRLRFLRADGLTRLVDQVERSTSIDRSIRMQWNPTIDVGVQLDAALEDRSLLGSALDSTRAYDLAALNAESNFSYRPTRSLELGWIIRVRSAEDERTVIPRETFLTGNEIRAIYSIETKGRLRATLERTVVSGRNVGIGDIFSLPFQLTDGYAVGTTWVGRLGFDYRIGANIQASVTYTGRAEPPSGRVIHTGQAEMRAFF